MLPRLRDVVGELHAKKVIHVRPECLFDAQGHFGRNAALPFRRSERVARRTFKISAAFDTLRPSASTISVFIRSPGCGGFFMGTCGPPISRQFPLTVKLQKPFRSPFKACRFHPGKRLSCSRDSAVSSAKEASGACRPWRVVRPLPSRLHERCLSPLWRKRTSCTPILR